MATGEKSTPRRRSQEVMRSCCQLAVKCHAQRKRYPYSPDPQPMSATDDPTTWARAGWPNAGGLVCPISRRCTRKARSSSTGIKGTVRYLILKFKPDIPPPPPAIRVRVEVDETRLLQAYLPDDLFSEVAGAVEILGKVETWHAGEPGRGVPANLAVEIVQGDHRAPHQQAQ